MTDFIHFVPTVGIHEEGTGVAQGQGRGAATMGRVGVRRRSLVGLLTEPWLGESADASDCQCDAGMHEKQPGKVPMVCSACAVGTHSAAGDNDCTALLSVLRA